MDHNAAPFVPKGRANKTASPQSTQPVTPPLSGQAPRPGLVGPLGGPAMPQPFVGASTYGYAQNRHGPMGMHHHHQHAPHHHHMHHPHHHHQHQQQYPPAYAGYPGSGPTSPVYGRQASGHFDPAFRPAPPPPPPSVNPAASKLRAGASEYVPGAASKKTSGTSTPNTAMSETATQLSEQKPHAPGESPTKLNVTATPYTPTRRLAGNFPPAPPLEGDALGAKQESAFTAATDSPVPLSPTTPMSPMVSNAAETFKRSKLDVPAQPKPAASLKFSTSWNLFADSHPIAIGGFAPQTDFNPTLLHAVADVETFWRLWRSMKPPSAQVPSFSFYFFRRLIDPTWEDPRNRNGGTIAIPLWDRDKADSADRRVTDDVWWLTTMCLVGESLPNPSTLNGAVLKIRQRTVLLQLWTNTTSKELLQPTIEAYKNLLKRVMPDNHVTALEFFSHAVANDSTSKPPSSPATSKPGKPKKPVRREADFKI